MKIQRRWKMRNTVQSWSWRFVRSRDFVPRWVHLRWWILRKLWRKILMRLPVLDTMDKQMVRI